MDTEVRLDPIPLSLEEAISLLTALRWIIEKTKDDPNKPANIRNLVRIEERVDAEVTK